MISEFTNYYPEAVQSLTQISLDTDKTPHESLCIDESKFLAFDAIIKKAFPNKQPASFDLLIAHKKKLFCVEFKNSRPRDINNKKVQNKAIEGIASLYSIAESLLSVKLNEYEKYYIVFYKPLYIQQATKSQNFLHNRATKKIIEFGLEKYHRTFYDHILTKECKDYKHIKSKLSIQ